MKFSTEKEIKAWFRGLSLLKKDLEMKSSFYLELLRECQRVGKSLSRHEAYYLAQIERLHEEMQQVTADTERIMDILTPEERLVITARYIKHLPWDGIEFAVHYSRRQAIRIHNSAIKKLIGQEVGPDVYRGNPANR
ncbi:MAG: hypothetical protein U0L92_03955 [Clostridia bacterium]|nr:hypothetical protein [Clostridia bacterium]